MSETIKQKLEDAYIETLLKDYKNLVYLLTVHEDDYGYFDYHRDLEEALVKARQTFPDLQKIYENKGEQNDD